MQTVKNTKKGDQCKCSLEHRLSHVGAKLDKLLEVAEAKQADLQGRASNAVNDLRVALEKIREELREIGTIASDARGKVARDLAAKEVELKDTPGESAPCGLPKCGRHEVQSTEDDSEDYNGII